MSKKGPETFPLHSLGVIDIAASDVPENELLAHALANVTREDKDTGWAIK